MRVALICPADEGRRVRRLGDKPRVSKVLRTNRISLLAVAAATPEDCEITYVDEYVEPVDFDGRFDLVGVSFMTALAPRAYEIGDEYRRRGVAVVFGGYHPTLMPEEAAEHCDAVCIGEAEVSWPQIIDDLNRGRLKRLYSCEARADLADIAFLRRDILRKDAYFTSNLVLAGRGCPHGCDFCSVTHFFDRTYRHRPVADIVREVESLHGNPVLFGDDNIVADQGFAKELFRTLVPLGRQWMSQGNLSMADDDELLGLAAESGCCGLFVGLESLSDVGLRELGKGFYLADTFHDRIARLTDYGIAAMVGFMLGCDCDDKGVFERTSEFIRSSGVAAAQIAILTPFPGTPLFQRLHQEGRIFDTDWAKYDFRHVVFEPKLMTAEDLQEGADWVISEVYSLPSILSRLRRLVPKWGLKRAFAYGLPLNLGYRQNFRSEGVGGRVS